MHYKSGWRTLAGDPLSVFENKVLLEPSHAHLFIRYLWLLSCFNGRVVETETIWAINHNIFTICPLLEKVQAPGLGRLSLSS